VRGGKSQSSRCYLCLGGSVSYESQPPWIHIQQHLQRARLQVAESSHVQVLNQTEARYNSADMNIAYRMNVDEYQKLCPYAEALEENWGKPPGMSPGSLVLVLSSAWLREAQLTSKDSKSYSLSYLTEIVSPQELSSCLCAVCMINNSYLGQLAALGETSPWPKQTL